MRSTVSRKPGRRRRVPAGYTNEPEEIARLKAAVHCATVLERATPPWQLDWRASTSAALKYRRGAGEILIVNHGGRGWWDPTHSTAKGDVFDLVQHLEPGLSFGAVRQRLRALAGIPEAREAVLAGPADVIAESRVWQRRQGGNLVSLYPYVLSAKAGIAERDRKSVV